MPTKISKGKASGKRTTKNSSGLTSPPSTPTAKKPKVGGKASSGQNPEIRQSPRLHQKKLNVEEKSSESSDDSEAPPPEFLENTKRTPPPGTTQGQSTPNPNSEASVTTEGQSQSEKNADENELYLDDNASQASLTEYITEVNDLPNNIEVYQEILEEDGTRSYHPYQNYEGLPHIAPKPGNFVCPKAIKDLGYRRDLWLHFYKFN